MGIGLSIARFFMELTGMELTGMELTGGELDIRSRLGEGTEMILRYPESLLGTASPEA